MTAVRAKARDADASRDRENAVEEQFRSGHHEHDSAGEQEDGGEFGHPIAACRVARPGIPSMAMRRVALALGALTLALSPAAAQARTVDFKVHAKWAAGKRYTKVKKLTLTGLTSDVRVELHCKGRGCPFKTKLVRTEGESRVRLAKRFRRRRLRVGAVLSIRGAAPRATGLVIRFKMRHNRPPKRTRRRIRAAPVLDPVGPGDSAPPVTPPTNPPPGATAPDPTAPLGERALDVAERYLGTPYHYGGATPETGFDSPGLTQYSYGQVGVSLPRIADDQCRAGTAVAPSALQLGDLVCFEDGTGYVDHVGLYADEGMFIHAPHTGDVVKYSSLSEPYYAARYRGARRFSG